jgi:RNA polymerase sigma-54 factor
MLKQNLSQKLLQKLSPQQIQLMKLLQIPTATLEQRIKEELEANPALEESEDADSVENAARDEDDLYDTNFANAETDSGGEEAADYDENAIAESATPKEDDINVDDYYGELMDDDVASYKLNVNNHSADDEDKTMPIAVGTTLQEYLESQLGLADLSEHKMKVALQVIGSIDDDGYLRRDPISLVDDLAFSQNVMTNEKEIEDLIKIVQRFEPTGVGATNLQECLSIQLHRRLEEEKEFYPTGSDDAFYLKTAITIIDKYFNEFSKKHYEKLNKYLNLQGDELKDAIGEILKLNPKPASAFATNTRMIHYIIPDFLINNEEGELVLTLNSRNAPELRVNDSYKDMLRSYDKSKKVQKPNRQQKDAVMFIKQKIDSAKWFIDAIRQRQQTMYKTMYSIMQYQFEYFVSGDETELRPMILKDIAEITGLDISTVSRVANSKYVQTEFGTKRLKDFFSESLQTKSGEEVSTLEVKKILTNLIDNESKAKPLSDEKLKNALRDKGYNIARRTVAKYREQLSIPVARLRKEL